MNLSEKQLITLAYLRDQDSPKTASQIADNLGTTSKTNGVNVMTLLKSDLIAKLHVNPGEKNQYRITAKGLNAINIHDQPEAPSATAPGIDASDTDPKRRIDNQIDALQTELQLAEKPSIKDKPLKIHMLTRLSDITAPDISRLLTQIIQDLEQIP